MEVKIKVYYSTKNQSTQIYVDGWKTVGTISINGNHRIATYGTAYSKTGTADVTVATIPSGYYPPYAIISEAHTVAGVRFVIHDTVRLVGTGTGTCNICAVWHY